MKNNHLLIFKEVKERLRDQLDSINSLDTKSGITLAFIGTFIGGLVNSNWFIGLPYYFLLPILTGFGMTVFFALKEIFADDFRKDPDPTNLINNYWEKNYKETIDQLISNFGECYAVNLPKVLIKKKYLNRSFLFLFLTIILLSVAIFFSNNKIIIEQLKIG